MRIIYRVFNRRLNVSSNIKKIFVKSIGYFFDSGKRRPLSKILDGATLDNSFKEISLFIHVLFK